MNSGYLPPMMDIEWERAPWNQKEPEYETCLDCNGDGGSYYNEEGVEISRGEYEKLSAEDKKLWDFEDCHTCYGSGIVEVQEEDYDEDWEY